MADKLSDVQQILGAVLDTSSQSLNVKLASSTEFELSSTDGDSVTAVPNSLESSAIVPNGTASGTTVVAAFSVAGYSSFNLVTNTTVNLTATTPAALLEFSPSDTDDVWITASVSVTPSATAGTVVAGTAVANIPYRRARVRVTHGGYTAGSFTAYVNSKS